MKKKICKIVRKHQSSKLWESGSCRRCWKLGRIVVTILITRPSTFYLSVLMCVVWMNRFSWWLVVSREKTKKICFTYLFFKSVGAGMCVSKYVHEYERCYHTSTTSVSPSDTTAAVLQSVVEALNLRDRDREKKFKLMSFGRFIFSLLPWPRINLNKKEILYVNIKLPTLME